MTCDVRCVQKVVTHFYIVSYYIKWVPTSWTHSNTRSVYFIVLRLGKKPAKKDTTPLPPKPKVPANLAEAVKVKFCQSGIYIFILTPPLPKFFYRFEGKEGDVKMAARK